MTTRVPNLAFDYLEEPGGGLWLGTHEGLFLHRDGEEPRRIRTALDPTYEVVFSLHRDSRGDLWVGTLGGGLGLLHEGAWRRFGAEHGLPDETANAEAAPQEAPPDEPVSSPASREEAAAEDQAPDEEPAVPSPVAQRGELHARGFTEPPRRGQPGPSDRSPRLFLQVARAYGPRQSASSDVKFR